MMQDDPSTHLFHRPSIRVPLEDAVSRHVGRRWRIEQIRDMSDLACHPCAILTDGSQAVFAKQSDAPEAFPQFEAELWNLRYLSRRAKIRIPNPIGIIRAEDEALLLMEALEAVERTAAEWRHIGETLARIHQVSSDACGFPRNGFLGPLPQDNTPCPDWPTFFGQRRLMPHLRTAWDSGHLPRALLVEVESLMPRLPELCGPARPPVLLHGDAQQNNFISTARGTYVVDPAIYYGHPEMDIALLDAWQPVPDEVFAAYRDRAPLAPDFPARRPLWRLPLYLAAVAIEGPMHVGRLTDALRDYR